MLNYRDYGILLQIEKYCQRIQQKINGITFDVFSTDEDLKEIICFNLLQIGELAKSFTDEFVKNHTHVPWKQIKGMRDKVAHGYGSLDLDLVFNTSKKEIIDLQNYCQKIISEEKVEKNN